MAFDTEFHKRVVNFLTKEELNEKLTNEQRSALHVFWEHPDKLNPLQLMQLLEIEVEADPTFTQDLIIQLWKAHPKVLTHAAKNNRYIFKLQEALTRFVIDKVNEQVKAVESLADKQKSQTHTQHIKNLGLVVGDKDNRGPDIKEMLQLAKATKLTDGKAFKAKLENFNLSKQIVRFPERDNDNNPFSKKSFYKAFEKDPLPRPLIPETGRVIPTEKRVAAILKETKNNQAIREKQAEIKRKNSIADFFRGIVTTLVDSVSPTKKVIAKPVVQPKNLQAKKPNQVVKKIVNAFSFIFRTKKFSQSKKTQQAEQKGYDSPNWEISSGYSSPVLDQSTGSGYSSPSVGKVASGYSSPSVPSENFAGYSSPSIGGSSNKSSTSGYDSPSIGCNPSPEKFASTTDTKFILFHVVNQAGDKSMLGITTKANARKVVKRLFPDESNIAVNNSKSAENRLPGKSDRVVEIHDNREIPEPTKRTTEFWASPILSPIKRCSEQALRDEPSYYSSPSIITVTSP